MEPLKATSSAGQGTAPDVPSATGPLSTLNAWITALEATKYGTFVIIDVFISLILGGVAWLADTSTTGFITFFLSSIFVLLIKLHGEMSGLESRISAALETQRQDNEEVRADVVKMLRVSRGLLRDKVFFDVGTKIMQSYAAVLTRGESFFIERARRVLTDAEHELSRLGAGQMVLRDVVNVIGMLRQRLDATSRSAFFTSYVRMDAFWLTSEGKAYHHANLTVARKKKIAITRVFIIQSEADMADDMLGLIEEQAQEKNMRILIAYARDLGTDAADMAIYDDQYLGKLELIAGDRAVALVKFSIAEHDLREAIEARSRIIARSEDALTALGRIRDHRPVAPAGPR
jgi:hypothetical protein